jgi:hypothetical protein
MTGSQLDSHPLSTGLSHEIGYRWSVIGYRFQSEKMTFTLTRLILDTQAFRYPTEIFSRFSRMAYNSPTFARPASRAYGGGGPHF